MFLGNTVNAATSGLDSIERQLAVLSQNVANADVPGYVRESVPLSSMETAGGPAGVRVGPTRRELDANVQKNLFAAVGEQSGKDVASKALAGIDQASGAPGSGQDLASLVGALGDSFSALTADPSNATGQNDVLNKAASLANGVHTLANTIVSGRQAAQNTLQQDVTTVNGALQALGTLNSQIIAAKSAGQSTAGLEDQRDAQKQTLAQLVGARFVDQPNGDTLAIAGNSILPLGNSTGPFALGGANFTAGTPAASVPPLTLNGTQISGLGGEVGANLTLRDTTLPAMQSQLDGFAQKLASAFNAQNVPLFTDAAGSVPSTPTLGFAADMQVSTAIQNNPAILKDGTGAPRPAGDTTVVQNVLSTVFGSGPAAIPAQASMLVAGYAQQAAQASAASTTSASLVTGLQSTLSSTSGVSVDAEMSKMVTLQNAYAANAKVISAVQAMWTQLLQSVP